VSAIHERFRDELAAIEHGDDFRRVDRQASQATAYVWGFQDAGGEPRDTGRASEFGWAYGTIVARHVTDRLGALPSIPEAWQSWRVHGEIRDRETGRDLLGGDE